MTTQYGFLLIQPLHRFAETYELACRTTKDLTPDIPASAAFMSAGGDWQEEDNGVWHPERFAYYLSSPQPLRRPACTKVCLSGAMHNATGGFCGGERRVCIGCRYCHIIYARTARHAVQRDPRSYDQVRRLLRPGGGKAKTVCVESVIAASAGLLVYPTSCVKTREAAACRRAAAARAFLKPNI